MATSVLFSGSVISRLCDLKFLPARILPSLPEDTAHTKRQYSLPPPTAVHLLIVVLDVTGLYHVPPPLPAFP